MPVFLNNIINAILPWVLAHGIKIAFIVLVAFAIHKIGGKALEKIIRRAVPPDDLSADAERKREDTLIIEIKIRPHLGSSIQIRSGKIMWEEIGAS